MTQSELSADAARNRDVWTAENAAYTAKQAREAWAQEEIRWGVFQKPEAEVGALPDVAGMDAVELGCGTAYFSAWLAKRGARPVGVDVTPAQLETARECQQEFGLDFPLHLGNAETTPFGDASFDGAISEYGAALWADPYAWIPEAARLLKPGGWLMFLTNSALLTIVLPDKEDLPATTTFQRPYFGMHRQQWEGDTSVEFHIPHGAWIDLLHENGFDVERLVELQPAEASTTRYTNIATLDWARQWPSEEAWIARKRG